MSNIGQTFEVDLERYSWLGTKDHPNEYPDDYPFGLSDEEQSDRYWASDQRHKQLQEELHPFCNVDSLNLDPEELLLRAELLAQRYALFSCKYGLSSHCESIDVETQSDASILETERWWNALEKLSGEGDWSYLIGELYREGTHSITASRRLGYKIEDEPENENIRSEFNKELVDAIADYIPGAFDLADSWYEEGVALKNLATILHDGLVVEQRDPIDL